MKEVIGQVNTLPLCPSAGYSSIDDDGFPLSGVTSQTSHAMDVNSFNASASQVCHLKLHCDHPQDNHNCDLILNPPQTFA